MARGAKRPTAAGRARQPRCGSERVLRRRDARARRGAAPCALALFAALGALLACEGEGPPNVLLVTLDTTRADHLGCYGYARPTTPELDRLCEDALVYTRAYSTSSWTLPAHASLFTGLYPASHGAHYDADGPLILADGIQGREIYEEVRAQGLASDLRPLAARLADHGYATAAVVAGPWMKAAFGLDRGFAHYDDEGIESYNGRRAGSVTLRALEWLERRPGDRPFFLFLNYFDPHAPYRPPVSFLKELRRSAPGPSGPKAGARGSKTIDRYDAEIRAMDHHLGRLLDALRRKGLYERTWILVTGDHGELLGEHGEFGHGQGLWEPEIRIPFVLKDAGPEPRTGRREALVQLNDVPALLRERLGLPEPEGGEEGAELLARRGEREAAFAQLFPAPQEGRRAREWRALVQGRHKLLLRVGGPQRLFDLRSDAAEEQNLWSRQPERSRALHERLEALRAALPAPPRPGDERRIDAETRRALRELGYLE